MTKIEDIEWEDEETLLGPHQFSVFIGLNKDGEYVIVSNGKPKFCFTVDTRVEALQKGQDALEYYTRRKINADLPTL